MGQRKRLTRGRGGRLLGCLHWGVGGGVGGLLLVFFFARRLVTSLPENHYGERYLAHGLQYASGDGVKMQEQEKERKRRS